MERIPGMIRDLDYAILGVMTAPYEYPPLKQVFFGTSFAKTEIHRI